MLPEVKANYGKLRNLINGEWVEPDASGWLDVENPATTGVIAQVPLSTPTDVNDAVAAAKQAFLTWRETPPVLRARSLFTLKGLMEQHFEEFAPHYRPGAWQDHRGRARRDPSCHRERRGRRGHPHAHAGLRTGERCERHRRRGHTPADRRLRRRLLVHHAVRQLRLLRPRARRPLRDLLRLQPPQGSALRRLDAPGAPAQRRTHRHVQHGRARRVRRHAGHVRLPPA